MYIKLLIHFMKYFKTVKCSFIVFLTLLWIVLSAFYVSIFLFNFALWPQPHLISFVQLALCK